jgi:hypothetical protein
LFSKVIRVKKEDEEDEEARIARVRADADDQIAKIRAVL